MEFVCYTYLSFSLCVPWWPGLRLPFTQTLEGSTLRISVHDRFKIWRTKSGGGGGGDKGKKKKKKKARVFSALSI